MKKIRELGASFSVFAIIELTSIGMQLTFILFKVYPFQFLVFLFCFLLCLCAFGSFFFFCFFFCPSSSSLISFQKQMSQKAIPSLIPFWQTSKNWSPLRCQNHHRFKEQRTITKITKANKNHLPLSHHHCHQNRLPHNHQQENLHHPCQQQNRNLADIYHCLTAGIYIYIYIYTHT